MSAQQQHHVTSAYLSSGSVAVGQCVVKDEDGVGYVVATAANRTDASRRSAGIAISSGDPNNTSFELQCVGEIPPAISGLAAGTATLVRVSTTGVLERTDAYSTSDDVCGHCDADGTAYVCFPLVGLGAALGASSAPGLPANSVQYYLDPNTLGGSAKAFIATDGALEIRTSSTSAATAGDIRFSKTASAYGLNHAGDGNVPTWATVYFAASADHAALEGLYQGWAGNSLNQRGFVETNALYYSSLSAGSTGSSLAGVVAFAPGYLTSAPNLCITAIRPNMFLTRVSRLTVTMTDPAKGGRGYFVWDARATAATGNPDTSTAWMYADETTLHPMWRLPDGTLYDLTDTGGGAHGVDLVDVTDGQNVIGIQGYPITNSPSPGQVPVFHFDGDETPPNFISWQDQRSLVEGTGINIVQVGPVYTVSANTSEYGVEISLGDADVDVSASELVRGASTIRVVGTATLTAGRVVKLPEPTSWPASAGGITTFKAKTYFVYVFFTGFEGAQSVIFTNSTGSGDSASVLADGREAITLVIDDQGVRPCSLIASV